MLKSILKLASESFTGFKEIIWNLNFSKQHTIKVLTDKKFQFVHYGDVTKLLFANQHLVKYKKSFEANTLSLYYSLLKPGDTILDIGANVGLFSILASGKIGAEGKIFAFEPTKKTFNILEENLKLNNCSNVFPVETALSNFKGKVSFEVPEVVTTKYNYGDSYQSMSADFNNKSNLVECIKLDEFIGDREIHHVDLIKIDIEGAEKLCFEGAERLFSKDKKPIIIMESDDSLCDRFGYTTFDTLQFLSKFGYSFKQYEHNQWLATPANTILN